MNEKVKFEKSSGNVFADLGVPNPKTEQLKSALSAEIFSILQARKLTQQASAEILGIRQPDVSKLKNGKFSEFSVERLMTFLNCLNRDVNILIERPKANSVASVHVLAPS